MWYVVQTQAGREQQTCDAVAQAAALADEAGRDDATSRRPLLEECFVPLYRTARKKGGQWEPCQAVLFPGYFIAVSDRARELLPLLRRVPQFARMVGKSEDAFVPLNAEEQAWIEAFTQRGHRVVEMSTAVRQGDRVRVIDGPLMHKEAWIRKVNDRKKVAYLELDMFGRTITAEVGLKVLRKAP